jgi:AraC-like DNA-binding protein
MRDDPEKPVRHHVATGRVYFWQGGSLWIGRARGRTDWHSHHALQIALALEGRCKFRHAADEAWSEFTGALVRPDRPHQFEAEDIAMAQLFVEPETVEGRALCERFAANISPLPETERAAISQRILAAHAKASGANAMIELARGAISILAGTREPRVLVDPRVRKAIGHLRSRIGAGVTLAEVAGAAALSPSRFRHLFVQETGSTFRAYALWLRLNVAIEQAMAGRSWTEAAHAAGFADSAHLNRTFRKMLGVNPSSLVAQ